MGIGYRIKEAREKLGMTQMELGKKVGVTGSAITNYEKETSHPKEQVIYNLMKVLNVDANYLFQDCMEISQNNSITMEEFECIKKYRMLDESGKKYINITIDKELERCASRRLIDGQLNINLEQNSIEILKDGRLTYYQDLCPNSNSLNAAHALNNSSEEEQNHDDKIMNDENF